MERGLEGGQRPHNRPLSPARRAQGERHGKKGRKRKDAGCSRDEQYHASPRPPGRGRDFSQVVPAPRQSLRRRAGVRTKGNTLGLTSCRPPCGDGCCPRRRSYQRVNMPPPMRGWMCAPACSESEAFVGTRGRRADGETFDSEREGGFRGRLQGGASGGKPQVSHNRPLACPARRAQGVIIEGLE